MERETKKAIELQGIVHNATKIGVQDGQCEDLVNLRFKDGSWRTSGDGKHVFSMNYQSDVANTKGVSYTQLYIHTNVYRHILGVNGGNLYWFGNINSDGIFEALDNPVRLMDVFGDLYICQTGHLLTIVDTAGCLKYFLYKLSDDAYSGLSIDENGTQTDRTIYPFGQIHFNYADAGTAGTISVDKTGEKGWDKWGKRKDWEDTGEKIHLRGDDFGELSGGGLDTLHNTMVKMYGDILEKNYFTDPFLVCAAIKLYDGKYMYASAPAMIFPRQRAYNESTSRYVHKEPTDKLNAGYDEIVSRGVYSPSGALLIPDKDVDASSIMCYYIGDHSIGTQVTLRGNIQGEVKKGVSIDLTREKGNGGKHHARQGGEDVLGVFRNGIYAHTYCLKSGTGGAVFDQYSLDGQSYWKFQIRGCNLCISIDSTFLQVMNDNKDIFKSLCIFVTLQSSVYKMDIVDRGHCNITLDVKRSETKNHLGAKAIVNCSVANMSYMPNRRDDKDIRYDLLHSPFYLLREYTQDELPGLIKNPIIDLQDPQYDGLLKNITQQETLKVEAINRYSFIPKAQYNYNGRLHIANYTQSQFHGYPLDTFHLNNHALEYDSELDNNECFKGSLPYLKSYFDETLSAQRRDYFFTRYAGSQLLDAVKMAGDVSAYVLVEIDSSDGIQQVCRYIPLITPRKRTNNYYDFIETLDPLLTFPDSRAKKMTISIMENINETEMKLYRKTFKLEAHPFLNMAYYMDEQMNTISLDEIDKKSVSDYQNNIKPNFNPAPNEKNVSETYPNGLKVSSTNNPLYFPVENTYRIGSSEIVAMMSNSVAVGTGQTGSAPLYIFCKDGVYAMFVDASGDMAYKNSRVIARDVCNNAKSVTPIDTGVVFTTDRGLMEISGERVAEIGAKMEGDWVRYTTQEHIDHSKIASNAYYMKRIAGLPSTTMEEDNSMTQTDFLTYLKGSIINYNHNERELMVSNPNYHYTYVLDRDNNWSRRDYRVEEYVNNFPTSYRVENGELYQVDKESDSDNGFFIMSHVLKMDSIGFKELHRLVVRGYFETISKKEFKTIEVPESKKVITISPATGELKEWSTHSNSTYFTRTIQETLYQMDIPESHFERELIVSIPTDHIISLQCDGCSINTEENQEITVTYKVTDDFGETIDYEKFDIDNITNESITINVNQFDWICELEIGKPYHIELTIAGQVHLISSDKRKSVEFKFSRKLEGDFGHTLTTQQTIDNTYTYPLYQYIIQTANEDVSFDNIPEEYEGFFNNGYLTIPENNVGRLRIKYDDNKIIINTESQTIIHSVKIGDGDEKVFSAPTLEFQIVDEEDNVVYSLPMLSDGSMDEKTTKQIMVGDVAHTYTLYKNIHVYVLGSEQVILLPTGKYRQRIVSSSITAIKETIFSGCEFNIDYHCVSNSGIQEVSTYSNIEPINGTELPATKLGDNGETSAYYGLDTSVLLGIEQGDNSHSLTYNSDAVGNLSSFTIPENRVATLSLSFHKLNDLGLVMYLEGKNKSGENSVIIEEGFDDYDNYLGTALLCICDNENNIVWSYRIDGELDTGKGVCVKYKFPKEYEDNRTVVDISLQAGTYHTEVRLQNIRLTVDEGYEHYINFAFSLNMRIDAFLSLGYTTSTYKMSQCVFPDILQSISQTIPAHMQQIVDTDNTFDTILGIYVFGSYDGRKWACLGHREKNGKFRDIGTLVERTDCRFFRFILAGQISKDSRIDYIEVSSDSSLLNSKIR